MRQLIRLRGRRRATLPWGGAIVLTVLLLVTSGPAGGHPVTGVAAPSFMLGAPTGLPTAGAVVSSAGGLSLNVTGAVVGALVSANGSGLRPNSTVNFTVGDEAAASGCLTDASGDFPAVGQECDFAIPPAPAGAENVTGTSPGYRFSEASSVGQGPDELAYDPNASELFVVNSDSENVSVINVTTQSTVANVPVGLYPLDALADPVQGRVYVDNYDADNVSVILDANDTELPAIPVGTGPYGMAFDPANQTVYVANSLSDTVSVISTVTDSVIATVPVGSAPLAVTYDPVRALVIVANAGSNNLTLIDAWNDTVLGSVALHLSPADVVYDPVVGDTFVGATSYTFLEAFNDSNFSALPDLKLPSDFLYSLGVDPAQGDLFAICGTFPYSLVVASPISDSVLYSLRVPGYAGSVAFDPLSRQAYVPDQDGAVVYRFAIPALLRTTLTIAAHLEIPGTLVSDWPVWFNGTGFVANGNLTTFALGGVPLACLSASVGECTSGILRTSSQGSVEASFRTPSASTPEALLFEVNDSAGDSASAGVTLEPPLEAGLPTSVPASVDLGQSVLFNATATNGAPPYTYEWYGLPTGCAGSTASVACTPTAAGRTDVSVVVNDSFGESNESPPLVFSVYSDPTIGTPLASSPWLELGSSVSFSANVSNGAPGYTYAWTGLPSGCSGTVSPIICTPTAAGTFSISVVATDGDHVSVDSGVLVYSIYSYPLEVTATSNRSSVDQGQPVVFTVHATLGTGEYRYLWQDLPPGCPETAQSVQCAPVVPGFYNFSVTATDTNGFSSAAGPFLFIVHPSPSVTLSASRLLLDEGQTVALSAVGANGSGGFSFEWIGLPPGCAGNEGLLPCDAAGSGQFHVSVVATDSNGASATSNTLVVTVLPPLAIDVSVEPVAPAAGVAVQLDGVAHGGLAPYSYAWSFGDGTYASGASVNHTFETPGSYQVTAWVNDSNGNSLAHTFTVSVVHVPGSSLASALETYAPVLVAAVALVVGLLGYMAFRRRRPPTTGRPPAAPGVSPAEAQVYGARPTAPEED